MSVETDKAITLLIAQAKTQMQPVDHPLIDAGGLLLKTLFSALERMAETPAAIRELVAGE